MKPPELFRESTTKFTLTGAQLRWALTQAFGEAVGNCPTLNFTLCSDNSLGVSEAALERVVVTGQHTTRCVLPCYPPTSIKRP